MARDVPIRGDVIRLGQLLKLAGVVNAGGDVKGFLAAHEVLVNGEPEGRRGRQLRPGDEVRVAGDAMRLVAARATPGTATLPIAMHPDQHDRDRVAYRMEPSGTVVTYGE